LIFVDTGAFVAIYLQGDQYHSHAFPLWKQLLASGERLYTSNFVLEETITLISRKGGYEFAVRKARTLYASASLEILRPDRQMELAAIDLFQKYADQEVGFTDCVSFVLMHAHRLTKVFCFDRHFDLPGFTRIPLVPLV
jgi:uncharacterized protein